MSDDMEKFRAYLRRVSEEGKRQEEEDRYNSWCERVLRRLRRK